MKTVGITGNISSGKSFVSEILKELGAYVIDMDDCGKKIQDENIDGALDKIKEAFGEEVISKEGKLNRRFLGEKVFKDRDLLEKLDSIMFPIMTEQLKKKLNELRENGEKFVVVEAAVLFEAGWDQLVDEVWVVYVPEEIQTKRLMERENIDGYTAKLRIKAQMPITEKIKRADVVIDNSGSIEELKRKVLEIWRERIFI